MRKIAAIAWKDLYLTYTDRNLLLIMLVTPLILATIIGLAFSNFFGGGAPIRDIPVALAMLDAGAAVGGQTVRLGDTFTQALVPPAGATADEIASSALFQMTNTSVYDSAAAARDAVQTGRANVAVIIPENFSASLIATSDRPDPQPVTVEVYASPSAPTSAEVVRSIVERIAYQVTSGSITTSATIGALVDTAQTDLSFAAALGAATISGAFPPDFSSAYNDIRQPVTVTLQTVQGDTATFNPLVLFGSGQALFFMMFTAMGSSVSMLNEQREGTLQRLFISPTSRASVLIGKLVGTFTNCVVQVSVLLIALTVIGSILSRQPELIWGGNPLYTFAVVLAVALAGTGLGALVAGLVRTPEQGNVVGSVIALIFGIFGGAFFNIAMLGPATLISRLTINYWGVDAFTKLALGDTAIGLNLVILTVMGAVLFVAGYLLFSRRLKG